MEFNPFKIIETIKVSNEVKKQKEQSVSREGSFPVIGCIVDRNNLDLFSKKMIDLISEKGINIDFHQSNEYMQRHGLITAPNEIKGVHNRPYVISQCDATDKFSKEYANCTGAVFVGKDKNYSKQLSFMSHWSGGHKEDFKMALSASIDDLIAKADEETIQAILFGGMDIYLDNDYKQTIKIQSDIILERLGVEPDVLTGPNYAESGNTDGYFDTQNHRLFIVRPEQKNNSTNHNYKTSEFDDQRKKWEENN